MALPDQQKHLTVSVVVPVRNEERYIIECLQALLDQDYLHCVEILVVDGMSDDGTRAIVTEFQSRFPGRIRLLDNPDRVVAVALNIGIAAATGDLLARADAHATYERDYFTQCVRTLIETGAVNVGGSARLLIREGLQARLIGLLHESPFGIGVAKFRRPDFSGGYVDTVWPGCFRREPLVAAGPYRRELVRTEDIEMNARLRAAGHQIYLSPAIRLYYRPRSTMQALLAQNYANGQGVVQCLAVAPRAVSLRHLVPLAFVLCLIGNLLGGLVWRPFWALFGLVMGLYVLAAAIFAVRAAPKAWHLTVLLPFAFFGLHLCYGLGSLSAMPLALRTLVWRKESR